MKSLWVAAAVAGVLTLSGCQVGKPGIRSDPHTGQTIVYSSNVSAASGLLSSLNAYAIHSTTSGYAVSVEYMTTGVGWAFLSEAYSFGKQFPYTVAQRQTLGCSGGCTLLEKGVFRLSKEDFETAARNGLEFKLVGSGDSVVGKMPGNVFQQVLDQMAGRPVKKN